MSTKRWSKDEEKFLVENYQKLSNKDLAEKFDVSEIAIQRKLARLNCHRQKQKKWTKDDETFLKKNYMKYNDRELAERFCVSEVAVKRKLHRLNLSRVQKRREKSKGSTKVTVKTPRATRQNMDIYKIDKKEYFVDQKIFHQIWKDEGTVKRLFRTREGNDAMDVNFKRLGEKTLIFGISD